ncbi:MAG: hypothetical protein KA205_03385 [Acidobacteria bacterium]|nr:hypothetical protein [Acidobacteriota bacterium]
MTQDRRENEQDERPTGQQTRRVWKRPTLTAYGPIGKLTQGGTGSKADGSSGKRASCL